ncbi:MAG: YaiI/YqxD family protein [Acidobacteriota bacterium]
MPEVFVDADGCPVKKEIYRVAGRHGLEVTLVSNSRMQVPDEAWIRLVVVHGGFDAADDWIVEHASAGDIVVTADIPLADRCLKKGLRALTPTGKVFTQDSIGEAMASRELLSYLREMGTVTGGPAPFSPKDRSRFLHELDQLIKDALKSSAL